MATAGPPPCSAHLVGHAFVQQYYHLLCTSPGLVYQFYQDISKLGRPEPDGTYGITTTVQLIKEKIIALDYRECKAVIKTVRSQDSFKGGVQVLVTGILIRRETIARSFAQTFFLAPQDKGFFVLNDIFEYIGSGSVHPTLDVAPVAAEPVVMSAPRLPTPPVQEIQVTEEILPSAEEAVTGEVYNPSENGDVPIIVESPAKIEDTPNKSYASMVMLSPPVSAPQKVKPKNVEPVSQEAEAEGYSIYIKGLPWVANNAMVKEVFKHFGKIKSDGIQVRSNQGSCFGFVEYEDASSVEKALEASPVMIGGSEAVVEEKRSTYSRGSNRGRFQNGRGSGYRSEGGRGRGSYGGGRGYNNRAEFSGRSDFVSRGGNRGGASNREGYQRSENYNGNGGGRNRRMNRNGGMPNGSANT